MVRAGLGAKQKELQPAYFYDALGSALFDAITRLPEYTITRAETALVARAWTRDHCSGRHYILNSLSWVQATVKSFRCSWNIVRTAAFI